MKRTKDFRLHQRERIIEKRLDITRNSWYRDIERDENKIPIGIRTAQYDNEKHRGRLNKYNLVCSCWACQDEKYDRSKQHKEDDEEILDGYYDWWSTSYGDYELEE